MGPQPSTPNEGLNENQRRALIASRLVDVSFGTMWWLREWMWKEITPPALGYDLDSSKWGHPGVSILGGPVPLQSFVPMMHGSSRGNSRSAWITGFDSADRSKRTAFGHLIRPGMFPQLFLGHFPAQEIPFRAEWAHIFGANCPLPPPSRQMVFMNEPKSKATSEESEKLRNLLRHLKMI